MIPVEFGFVALAFVIWMAGRVYERVHTLRLQRKYRELSVLYNNLRLDYQQHVRVGYPAWLRRKPRAQLTPGMGRDIEPLVKVMSREEAERG